MPQPILIFTDLDGTLLDHHNYGFAAALPMLNKLNALAIPVIPNTSKTYAEVIGIRQTLALNSPFIVENGAAVYIPVGYFKQQPENTELQHGYWVKAFSKSRQVWLSILDKLAADFAGQFNHFANMSVMQICDVTGLSVQEAQQANQREYTEPVLWQSSQQNKGRFIHALQQQGVEPVEGGRFLHLTGNCNKGQAMQWLAEQYAKHNNQQHFTTIALGDGHNDIAMLEAADIAVRILSPVGELPQLNKTYPVFTSTECGPVGWNNSLQQILTHFLHLPEVDT